MTLQILKRVVIKKLFGELDYNIDFATGENVSLLYGQNGSGKTTVLRMIYAALSSKDGEGLRSYFRYLSFASLHIETSVGLSVSIVKKKTKDTFYRLILRSRSGVIDTDLFTGGGETNLTPNQKMQLQNTRKLLEETGFDIHYLSDDRLLRSSSNFLATSIKNTPDDEYRWISQHQRDSIPLLVDDAHGQSDRTWLDIKTTAAQVTESFRRQLLEQGYQGQRQTNDIYLELAKRLVTEPSKTGENAFESLTIEMETVERERNASPVLKDLISFPSGELTNILNHSPLDRRLDLVRILRPYLDSTRARIDAVTPLAKMLGLLIDELNRFFSRKHIAFHFGDSFVVQSSKGEKIDLGMLSSGEKQIFLLLCSAILSRQTPCIFLIDEPELSLNVYWQRTLPRTLQRLVDGAQTQYVLATHSLEILTEFSDRIVSLEEQQ